MAYTTRPLTLADVAQVAALHRLAAAELMRTGQHPPEYPLRGWTDAKAAVWLGRGHLAGGVYDAGVLVLAWFGSVADYQGAKAVQAEWRFRAVGMTEHDARLATAYGTRDYVVPRMVALGLTVLFARVSSTLEIAEKRTFTALGWVPVTLPDTRWQEWAVRRANALTAANTLIAAG